MEKMTNELRRWIVELRGGEQYVPVAARLAMFRKDHPDWTIESQMVHHDTERGFCLFKAELRDQEGRLIASAHKHALQSRFPYNYIERAETGAIGRVLAFAGYGTLDALEILEEDLAELTEEKEQQPPETEQAQQAQQAQNEPHEPNKNKATSSGNRRSTSSSTRILENANRIAASLGYPTVEYETEEDAIQTITELISSENKPPTQAQIRAILSRTDNTERLINKLQEKIEKGELPTINIGEVSELFQHG